MKHMQEGTVMNGFARLAAMAGLGALLVASGIGVTAASTPYVTTPPLDQRVATLEKQVKELIALKDQVTALQKSVSELQDRLQAVKRDGNTLIISGANLQLNNGTGRTDTGIGTGNLILGYNEGAAQLLGSHNLLIGRSNNATQWGSLVIGERNEARSPFCFVAGFDNKALANSPYATVSGGVYNEAAGQYATIAGGSVNRTQGSFATVIGGNQNWATAEAATAVGGSGIREGRPYGTTIRGQ